MNDSKVLFVIASDVDGKEIITRGRRFMKEVRYSGKYPDLIEIVWSYKATESGMPDAEADKFMNEVIFKLADAEEAEKTAYMVAIYTGNNMMTITFYTSDIEQLASILNDRKSVGWRKRVE